MGYSPQGYKESDTTERFHFLFTVWMGLGLVLGVGISGKLVDDLKVVFSVTSVLLLFPARN